MGLDALVKEKETYAYGGQGDVSFAVRNALGKPLGFRQVGEVDALEFELNSTYENMNGNRDGKRGVIKRRLVESKCSQKSNWLSRDPENLALLLNSTAENIAAGTVTNQTASLFPGTAINLGYMNVSTVVVTSVGGTTTYTDYTLHPEWGHIIPTKGGDLEDAHAAALAGSGLDADGGLPIEIDFAYGKQERIGAFTNLSKDVHLLFLGINDVESGDPVMVHAYRVALDPLKGLGVINAKGFAPMSVSGEVMADPTRPAGQSQYFDYFAAPA